MSDSKYKVVLLGDSTVGKTCLTLRFCKNTITKNHMSTIGVDVHKKNIDTSKGPVLLQIWDTAGQERFRSISASYLRNTDGVLLLYDITSRESFEHVTDWLQAIKQNCSKEGALVLVGNKKDLEADRKVSNEEGISLAQAEGAQFLEVSAYTGENVENAFKTLAEEINSKGTEKKEEGMTLGDGKRSGNKGCCGGGSKSKE